MERQNILNTINNLPEDKAKAALIKLLERTTSPAFAILPQRELDLLLFEVMRDTGLVSESASLYSLMTDLRVSRAKARNMLFDYEIRRQTEGGSLDASVLKAISQPRGFALDGNYIVLGIENPVVQAHLKEKVRVLGHLTDASFDSSLVRIKPAALAALSEGLMSDADKKQFSEAMVEAGFRKDTSLKTALSEGLKYLAGKAVGETAAGIAGGYIEDLADLLMPAARGAKTQIVGLFKAMFAERDQAERPLEPRRES